MPTNNPRDIMVGGDHYKKLKIQPYEFCYRNGLNNLQSEAISYISRYPLKWVGNQKKQIEDLEKAKHTLDLLIEELRQGVAID